MKTAARTLLTLCAFLSLTTSSQTATITDLHPDDLNLIVSQHQDGNLIVGENLGDTTRPFDCVLTLDANDLTQPWGGLWFNIVNTSPNYWTQYWFEFYDSTFTSSIRLPLHSFWLGPNELLPERDFLPNFMADTIALSGGTGLDPGQFFDTIFLFELAPLLNNEPNISTYSIGIRQTAVGTAVPDATPTASLFAIAMLGTLGACWVSRSKPNHDP